jgi:copper chaperone CopZ
MKGVAMSLDGVREVIVHYDKRELEVTFDENKITAEVIIGEIGRELGLMMRVRGKDEDAALKPEETCPM